MGSAVRSKKMAVSEPPGRLPAAMAATQGSHLSQCRRPCLATSPRRQGEVTRLADIMRALISDSIFKQPIQLRAVIPGRAKREPGIHNHDREYGFRACAKRRIPE
jgi:hypothetical protein